MANGKLRMAFGLGHRIVQGGLRTLSNNDSFDRLRLGQRRERLNRYLKVAVHERNVALGATPWQDETWRRRSKPQPVSHLFRSGSQRQARSLSCGGRLSTSFSTLSLTLSLT